MVRVRRLKVAFEGGIVALKPLLELRHSWDERAITVKSEKSVSRFCDLELSEVVEGLP